MGVFHLSSFSFQTFATHRRRCLRPISFRSAFGLFTGLPVCTCQAWPQSAAARLIRRLNSRRPAWVLVLSWARGVLASRIRFRDGCIVLLSDFRRGISLGAQIPAFRLDI